MDSQAFVRNILENIAEYKDLVGGAIFGGKRRRRTAKRRTKKATKKISFLMPKRRHRRRRSMRGKGLLGFEDEMSDMEDMEGMEESGSGIYGLEGEGIYGLEGGRRRRTKRRGPKNFNIGKYSHAISQGKTKEQAKRYATGSGVNALY